jgi:fructose-1,6-bisphosphatase/inositol monophosphatase family enzyme
MNYDKELDFAKDLAREAGEIMRENFIMGSKREWKADNTPVTVTDTTINSLVIERIKAAFPSHSVVGEEESFDNHSDMTWVCDPVDGTMPFSHGLPISTFSLALTKAGVPLLGVVYDPFMDRLFYAAKDRGAYMNEAKISVNNNTELKNTLINAEGFPGSSPAIENVSDFLNALKQTGAHVTTLWSVILPTALIAAGQFTAVVFNVTKPEDGAAIKVIVEEAGGKVTDLFGNEQRYDRNTKGFLASNGKVHDQLLQIIRSITLKS